MKCPHCGKVPYPVKNEDGTINWRNTFRIDWLALFLTLSIILLLIGFGQITSQCRDVLKNPCDYLANFSCINGYMSISNGEVQYALSNITTGIHAEDSATG